MSRKKTIQHYADIANSRNHELVSVSNLETPSQGTVTILCKTCNTEFTNGAETYKKARVTGCPNCKRINTSKQWLGKTRTISPEIAAQRAVIKKHKEEALQQKAKAYAGIKNLNDLKAFLLSNKNSYNDFILTRLNNPVTGLLTEKHHIIPIHAGGPDVPWNLIGLTPEDHMHAHELRALVYNEPGDRHAVRLRGNGTVPLTERRIQATKIGDVTRREQGTGIYAEGASAKGGRVGGAVKSQAKDLQQSTKMSTPVFDALYKGSCWYHSVTGVRVTVKPQAVVTMPALVNLLISSLPPCEDKDLLTNAAMTTITSNLARVIKKERQSSYGWCLL